MLKDYFGRPVVCSSIVEDYRSYIVFELMGSVFGACVMGKACCLTVIGGMCYFV